MADSVWLMENLLAGLYFKRKTAFPQIKIEKIKLFC